MNCAVITETRELSIIPQVIESHLSMLPDDFELVVFCSNNNRRYFNDFDCAKYIVSINTLNEYNNLMTSEFYWSKLLAYEHALIFQTDSKILKGIEDFFVWDYIGSPWKFQDHGGNGGLSLRSPKVMMNIINECHYSGNPYEDVWFSNHLPKYGKLAPRNECKKFSCETIFELGTWGYHAIKNYMNHEQIKTIENQYQ